MWFLMFVIALVQSAHGGYEYPKPRIPFELPNRILHNSEGQTLKTSSIDITKTLGNFLPNDDYRYSQQYTNEERIQSGVVKTLLESTVQSDQQNFEKSIKQVYPDLYATQYYVDATAPIQNVVTQSSLLKDLYPIQQSVQLSTNYPEQILNIKQIPPLISLKNSKNELLDDPRVPVNEPPLINLNNHRVENLPALVNFNINQVETINENNIPELINIPQIEPQQNEYLNAQIVQESHQNEDSAIGTIPPTIRDFVPNVLNILNSVQPSSGEFNEQVADIQENKSDLLNLNVEQTKFNVQNSRAASYEESGLLNNQLSSLSFPTLSAVNIATPVITKSISFHVPPPDIEETSVVSAIPTPRKTYKIIFVKTPTYENRYNQQLQASRLAPVEEKTIIYVLSKKAEDKEQVVLPQPTKVSEHEVLYVQYKGDLKIDPEQINENVSQLPINSAGAAYVEPRLLDHH